MDDTKASTSEEDKKRERFGGRYLTRNEDVYSHNAWDNVEFTPEMEENALAKIDDQLKARMNQQTSQSVLENQPSNWDDFYNVHDNKFFKPRNWLFTEFPDLLVKAKEAEVKKVFKNFY